MTVGIHLKGLSVTADISCCRPLVIGIFIHLFSQSSNKNSAMQCMFCIPCSVMFKLIYLAFVQQAKYCILILYIFVSYPLNLCIHHYDEMDKYSRGKMTSHTPLAQCTLIKLVFMWVWFSVLQQMAAAPNSMPTQRNPGHQCCPFILIWSQDLIMGFKKEDHLYCIWILCFYFAYRSCNALMV